MDLRSAMASLPAAQRAALELAYYQGFSHSQIAAHLGEPLGTIKTRIRQAMLALRQALEPILSTRKRSANFGEPHSLLAVNLARNRALPSARRVTPDVNPWWEAPRWPPAFAEPSSVLHG